MTTSTVETVGFYDSKMSFKNMKVSPKRTIKFYEIELFTETGGITIINDRQHKIRKGMLLVAKPNQTRNSILHFKAYYAHINLSDPTITSYLDKIPNFTRASNFDYCASLFTAMTNAENSQDPAKCLFLKSKLYELTHMIYTSSQNRSIQNVRFDEANFETVTKAANYIDNNFGKEINLDFLSAIANLSPTYFHKMFKRYFGKTPHKYLLEKRIEAAKALLISTNLSITEIAFKTGFNSQSYFNYSFKKLTQTTPLQFRQMKASMYQL